MNQVYQNVIGTHIKKSPTFLQSLKNFYNTPGNSYATPVQIFTGSPRTWKLSKRNDEDESITKEYVTENNINLFIHSMYLINLAKPKESIQFALDSLQNDLNIGKSIGCKGVVVHVGKYCKDKPEVCIKNMETNMRSLTIHENCPLLLETPAGQGTELLTKIEDFEEFMKGFALENEKGYLKYGICVDTCHVFASGYSPLFYLENLSLEIQLIHLNDSKEPKGSKKDRHEVIGDGHIGAKELIECSMRGVPCVTE